MLAAVVICLLAQGKWIEPASRSIKGRMSSVWHKRCALVNLPCLRRWLTG